tara:strand:- start:190 stop:1185 length:996 start_codon:yes stop_codon:yes gene_type:complete
VLGGVLALLAAATFGFNAVAIRRGVLTGSVAQGLAITVPIAIPIFLIAVIFTGGLSLIADFSVYSIILFSISGAVHFNLGRYANYRATKAMGANLVGPIISANLIITIGLAIIFLNEEMTPLRVIGIFLIILGLLTLLRSPGVAGKGIREDKTKNFQPRLVEGWVFSILCAVIFGSTPILIRMAFLDSKTEGLGPGLAGGLIAYISATVFLGLYYAVKPSVLKHCLSIDRQAAKWFVLTGFLVCASHMFRFMALAVAPVSVVSPLVQTSGIFRTILGWFINRDYEVFDRWVLSGILITILGAVALTLSTDLFLSLVNLPNSIERFFQLSWP